MDIKDKKTDKEVLKVSKEVLDEITEENDKQAGVTEGEPSADVTSQIRQPFQKQEPEKRIVRPLQEEEKASEGVVENRLVQMGKDTREYLRKHYPEELVMIPQDPLNKGDGEVVVAINGYIWQIQRGKSVKLPSPVVDLLVEGGYNPTLVRGQR